MINILMRQPMIWGPIFLLCTIAIATKNLLSLDLLFLSLSGLYLSAIWKMRGCCYAFVLLFITAILRHLFVVEDHLFQLGIESSLACAFFITAIAFEHGASFIDSLTSQVETRKAALENLEEEIAKVQENALATQIAFQEKIALAQKELEELQVEHSSILILNEVLRKTTARHIQENESLVQQTKNLEQKARQLSIELEGAQKEIAFLSDGETLGSHNRQLIDEINCVRAEKEQTHLINETLARLYARETFKAQEFDREAAELKEQLRHVAAPYQGQIETTKKEAMALSQEFDKVVNEAHSLRNEITQLKQIQSERNFLKERLALAQEEIVRLQNQAIDPQILEQLAYAQERIQQTSSFEPLYKQLKQQFEEKNKVLHEVRSELFKADTELQRLKMENAALDLQAIPKEFEQELEKLTTQLEALDEENLQLQDIITSLTVEKKK